MSASTGTADDRGGNDKADALVESKGKNGAFSAASSWTRQIGTMIYDISRGGMQPGEPENRQVWLNGDRTTDRRGLAR
jgi:hypothetical protein